MSTESRTPRWRIFRPDRDPVVARIPTPPPWRDFRAGAKQDGVAPIERDVEPESDRRGATFRMDDPELEIINAAIHLRRPLLVTGQPGSGKSSLAYALAYRLKLGKVLRWSINSRSTLKEGLYEYDAVARLRALNIETLRAAARATDPDEADTERASAEALGRQAGAEEAGGGRPHRLVPPPWSARHVPPADRAAPRPPDR
ncbi:MAG: ATP-binding protein [Isosphaeraceae bacterium]